MDCVGWGSARDGKGRMYWIESGWSGVEGIVWCGGFLAIRCLVREMDECIGG